MGAVDLPDPITPMPRFAFATPFLPDMEAQWRAVAAEIPIRRANDHRAYMLARGIFKDRWWMQTGTGSLPLSLMLWDCDDLDRATEERPGGPTGHEEWLRQAVVEGVHGRSSASFELPTSELLSGTTTAATATAGTQTMFALPIPVEGVAAVRALVERIEQGDLADAHRHFLTESSIREEWIWLQPEQPHCPPLLLVYWIGDDLDHAWQRLTYVRDDDYARVLHEALFTRLVGISPERVADWSIEQLLSMHVRRSDRTDTTGQRLAHRFFVAATEGRWPAVERMLAPDVVMVDDGGRTSDRTLVVGELKRLFDAGNGSIDVHDLLLGDHHVVGLLRDAGPSTRPVMLVCSDGKVGQIRALAAYTP